MTAHEERGYATGSGEGGRSLFDQIGRLGWKVHSATVTRGDRAELRRMKPDGIPPEIYWRLTDDLDRNDELWMTVLPLMIVHPHEPGARPGRVLARNGIKAARAQRWLRRDRASAWEEAGRFLGPARGVPLDWSRFGTLLARWDDPERRRSFARDYFSEIHKIEQRSSNATGGA